ncbi:MULTISPECIES: hypothetical protein [Paracoccus]|uniref:hypothetical protein n=1 Tax=Paracoccus TaxID=265 RepID=UPI001FB81CE5|nr:MULTISPECIES: hypothetical protein [Paracoccus]
MTQPKRETIGNFSPMKAISGGTVQFEGESAGKLIFYGCGLPEFQLLHDKTNCSV